MLRPSTGGEIPVAFSDRRDADRKFADGEFVTLPVRYSRGHYCYARRYSRGEVAEDYKAYAAGSYMNGYTYPPASYGNDRDDDDMYGNYYAQDAMNYNDGDADDNASYYDNYGYASPDYSNYYGAPNYDGSQGYYNPNYSTYNPYYNNYMGNRTQQSVAGLIIARNGANLEVLTPGFTP